LIGANPGNGNAFSASYIHVSIISYFLNPVELSYLAYVFAMKWFEMNTPIDPASYGVSLFSMIVAVALWVLLPLGTLLLIVKRRGLE
jgi:hypothetical protein